MNYYKPHLILIDVFFFALHIQSKQHQDKYQYPSESQWNHFLLNYQFGKVDSFCEHRL
jgi:hypothetical protein